MEESKGYYRLEDLDYIFVTETDKTGNIGQLSLKQLSGSQFELWAKKRFQHLIPEDVLEDFGKVWNYHMRLNLINRMCEILGRPSCVMKR
jgi:hypothetical protein